MHKTQAYKTCDGKLFDDEADAALHETKLKIGEWAERKGIAGNEVLTCDNVAKAMIDDAEELAHLFVNLVRALPRTSEGSFIGGYFDLPAEQNTLWRVNSVNGERASD